MTDMPRDRPSNTAHSRIERMPIDAPRYDAGGREFGRVPVWRSLSERRSWSLIQPLWGERKDTQGQRLWRGGRRGPAGSLRRETRAVRR